MTDIQYNQVPQPPPLSELPPPPLPKKTFWQKLRENIADKREIKRKLFQAKKKEEEAINEIKSEARIEAIRELKPELVKQFKEIEIKRITGQDKEDKLKKFANMFATSGGRDVGSMMSGGKNPHWDMLAGDGNRGIDNDRIGRMMDIGSKEKGVATNSQLNKMLKRKNKYGQ